jgi:hypothetical protein
MHPRLATNPHADNEYPTALVIVTSDFYTLAVSVEAKEELRCKRADGGADLCARQFIRGRLVQPAFVI